MVGMGILFRSVSFNAANLQRSSFHALFLEQRYCYVNSRSNAVNRAETLFTLKRKLRADEAGNV
jgi:hypothetical protein